MEVLIKILNYLTSNVLQIENIDPSLDIIEISITSGQFERIQKLATSQELKVLSGFKMESTLNTVFFRSGSYMSDEKIKCVASLNDLITKMGEYFHLTEKQLFGIKSLMSSLHNYN